MDYNTCTVAQLKDKITDKDDFLAVMGISMSSARKAKLVEYLNKRDGVTQPTQTLTKSPSEPDLARYISNKPFDPTPPKLDKTFVPDTTKLDKIRETLPQPEPTQLPQLDQELTRDLDDDDVHKLGNILSDEVTDSPSYTYDETCETKCKKYATLYPNIKPILSSPEFKSSEEKLKYVEQYLNSTRMNANITNYLFIGSTMLERNESVNKYIKLKGYTKQLAMRRNELETYIEELKIKYMDEVGQYLDMPVEARIGLLFAETALTVHLTNSENQLKAELQMKSQAENNKK